MIDVAVRETDPINGEDLIAYRFGEPGWQERI